MLTTGPTQREAKIAAEHVNYMKDLTEKGIGMLFGRTLNSDEATLGIFIFKAADDAAAKELIDNDPAVRAGVMKPTLLPFKIAMVGENLLQDKDSTSKPPAIPKTRRAELP